MNASLTNSKRASKDFTNLFHKKKSIPISINTNPNSGQFLFKNNVSNIATSYKNISEKIQNVVKQNKIPQSKCTSNSRLFNNFLSVNTINSNLSNQSSVSNNMSNIISQRMFPAKNLSTTSFSKGFLMNAHNRKQMITISNRNYLQVKTDNSLIAFAKDKNHKTRPRRTIDNTSNELIKTNTTRQKSIGALPSSQKKMNIAYEYINNEVKLKSLSNNNFNTIKNSKATISNVDKHLRKKKLIKQKISTLKYNFKNFIKIAKQVKHPLKEKILSLTTKSNQSYTLNNKAKKRGLSHDMGKKGVRTKSSNLQMKGVVQTNNRTISINQISNYSLQSTLINIIKENNESNVNNKPPTPRRIHNHPIQVNVQTQLFHSTLNSNNQKKNVSNENINLDIVNNNEETEHDNFCQNEDKYNMFDYLFMCDNNSNEEKEDKFDDLNSIVRAIDFKCVLLKEETLFNNKSNLYQKFEQSFNNWYNLSSNKAKCSERKKINISVSTQDNSYKKCLSPFH